MKVSLIGIGMDGAHTLTQEAAEAIHSADLLIGASRMLAPYAHLGKQQEICYDFREIAQILMETRAQNAAVLLSGDTGFFSGAKKLLQHLGSVSTPTPETSGQKLPFDIRVLPGISSLAYLCAKTGLSYENMKIISLHGREDNIAVHVLQNAQTFFLLGGKTDAAALCCQLCLYGLPDVMVHIGENLGTDAERVTSGTARELCGRKTAHLTVAIVENPAPLTYLPCGIPDTAFLRVIKRVNPTADTGGRTDAPGRTNAAAAPETGNAERTIPMTKSQIRAVAVSRLQIRRDDVCWDVGCGTGSVSVEMALHCPHGMVYGYDRNDAAAELTMRNARKFSCDNIRATVCSFPPESRQKQDALPVPDRVFIGGAGGRVDEILDLALRLNPDVRVLITAVSLETLELARAAMARRLGSCSVTQLAVTKAVKTGSVSMLKAQNPIFLIEAETDHE